MYSSETKDRKIDHKLIMDAQRFASGEEIHKLANLECAYRSAASLVLEYPNEGFEPLFDEAEKDLRKFLRNRLEQLDTIP
jgi:hypothetical protein